MFACFFFNDTATTEIYTLSLHDALPICGSGFGATSSGFTDALYDDRDGQAADPRWLVVDPGILRSERLVPAAGSWETESGELVIPFDKGWVKDAPTVSSDHVVDAVTEKAAIDHYGLPN